MNILEEANEITSGARRSDYGHPSEGHKVIASYWSLILDHEVTAWQVSLMMIALKLAREGFRHSRDNCVDIAGYARTLEMMHEDVISQESLAQAWADAGVILDER